MKLAFLWDWPSVDHQTIGWMDGLAAAIKELENRGHHVGVFTCGEYERELKHPYFQIHVRKYPAMAIEQFQPNIVLMWGDQTRPNAKPVFELGFPMALCFAGGNLYGDNVDFWDHIFVESQVYYDDYVEHGYSNVSIAFGTNTQLFAPSSQNKVFDTIFPATFAEWKRHGLYAEATQGLNSLAVGLMQANDVDADSWRECLKRGVTILPHVTADVLKYLYDASRVCVVTSRSGGGSQRTVLEAMAMNIPLIITDSDKFDWARGHGVFECEPDAKQIRGCIEAILDGEQEVNTRDYILKNWSEKNYADALEEGLTKIL